MLHGKTFVQSIFLVDAELDVEDMKLKDDPCLSGISNLVGENLKWRNL